MKRPALVQGEPSAEGRAGFLQQRAALQAEPNCREVLAACQGCRKSAEVKILLICTHTGDREPWKQGRERGREEEKRRRRERTCTRKCWAYVCGGVHFQSKNTNDPNKAQAVLKPCSQLVHINN